MSLKNFSKLMLVMSMSLIVLQCTPNDFDGIVDHAGLISGKYFAKTGSYDYKLNEAINANFYVDIKRENIGASIAITDGTNYLLPTTTIDYTTLYYGYSKGDDATTYNFEINGVSISIDVTSKVNTIKAECEHFVFYGSSYESKEIFAYLETGKNFNKKISASIGNAKIIKFRTNVTEELPDGARIVNLSDSLFPIWLAPSGDTLFVNTPAKEIVANSDCSQMFQNLKKIEGIEFGEHFNTSNVTNMSSMFYYCSAIKTIDLSKLNTSNVTNVTTIFFACQELQTINICNVDFSKVQSSFLYIGGQSNTCTLIYNNELTKVLVKGWLSLPENQYFWLNESDIE